MADTAEFQFMQTVVVKPHTATDETQLELRVGDIVYVLEQDDSGWWGGHKEGEDCTGWFPGSCVRALPEDAEQNLEPPSNPTSSTVTPLGGAEVQTPASLIEDAVKAGCEGLELDDALHRGGPMVASPSRRVSASSPTRPKTAAPEDVAATNWEAEYRTVSAIAEDRAQEIQQLQTKLNESESIRKSEANSFRRQIEELRRQCETIQAEKTDLQTMVQDLNARLSSEARGKDSQMQKLRGELTRAQQEAQEFKSECDQMRARCERQLQEKDAEIHDILEQQRISNAQTQAAAVSSASQAATDDTRRRLFPSQVDPVSLFQGNLVTPTFSVSDVAQPVPTQGSVVSNASSTETVPRQTFRPPTSQNSRPAPAASMPRPYGGNRATSLTRPAFRAMPNASSPRAMSPGGLSLSKCLSTGDLPPTPRLMNDDEAPMSGCVKERKAFFEKVTQQQQAQQRAATPKRHSVNVDGRSAAATPGNTSQSFLSQRSPIEQRCRDNAPVNSQHKEPAWSARSAGFPAINTALPEAEDAVDGCEFNLSPMGRRA